MASPSFAPSRRRSITRIIIGVVAGLLVAFIVCAGVAAWWFHHTPVASLPQLDGAIKLAGLSAPVQVVRDAHGMPHIAAQNLDDLFFAQGFVTAQDRLWQMDINRRFGRGELSEILGERTLRLDKQQRTLRLKQAAELAVPLLPERTRHQLEMYARGVNALIAQQKNNLPIEFRILRYQPREWTVADSITIGLNIAQSLNTQYDTEHDREELIAKLTPEETADLYPNISWRDRPPSSLPRDQQYTPVPPPSEVTFEDSWLRGLLPQATQNCDDCMAGSNNWVVSGEHTASGKPLLSNDMHLQHSIPSVWYETHITSGGYDAAGVSFPGLPWIIAGHNQRIAWGYTNVGPDVQDVFVENFNAQGEYETPHGWAKPEIAREVIKVKGGEDVGLDVQVTRHGPIISGLFPGEQRRLALQWTIYDPKTVGLPFFDINSAQDWDQFTAAISNFGGATQNVVYADVDGHIGYHAAGWIPIRNSGDGLLPMPGNTAQYDWTGYIPFGELPSIYDPATGAIGTANGRITPDGYKYLIANQWGPPYRTERILRVIENSKNLTAADMLHLQMDTYSEFDRVMADSLVYAIDHTPNASARAKQAADIMRSWNGRVETDSAAATIAVSTRRELWRMLLEPKVGKMYADYHWYNSSTAMERLLRVKPKRWLPAQYPNWDVFLTAAVESAIKNVPRSLSTWQYGPQYPIRLNHPLFAPVPWLNRYSGPGTKAQSGDGLTVKAAGTSFGASERLTVDLADLDQSTLNIVVGQSGQIFSPHYLDHWEAWYRGSTFAWPFTPAAVNKASAHHLELRP